MRTEMMSIAMPQPAKVKDPCSCRPTPHARLTQTLHTGGSTGSGVDTVYQGNGDNLPRTPQWQMIKGRRDRAGALPKSRRWQGGREAGPGGREENCTHPVELGWPSTRTQALGWQTGPATPLGRRWASQPALASSGKG